METIITWILIYFAGVLLKSLFNKRNATPVKKSPGLNKAGKHIAPPIISTSPVSFPLAPPLDDPLDIPMESTDIVFKKHEDSKVSSQHQSLVLEGEAVYMEEMDKEYDGIEFTQSAILNGIILSEILGAPKARTIRK